MLPVTVTLPPELYTITVTAIPAAAALKNLNSVLSGNEQLAQKVDSVIESERFPLVLGGDHSIAIGTLTGTAKHYNSSVLSGTTRTAT